MLDNVDWRFRFELLRRLRSESTEFDAPPPPPPPSDFSPSKSLVGVFWFRATISSNGRVGDGSASRPDTVIDLACARFDSTSTSALFATTPPTDATLVEVVSFSFGFECLLRDLRREFATPMAPMGGGNFELPELLRLRERVGFIVLLAVRTMALPSPVCIKPLRMARANTSFAVSLMSSAWKCCFLIR